MSLPATIPARFEVEIPVKPRNGIDGAIMKFQGKLPFIPQIGMNLIVVKGDDYRKVEDIHYSEEDGLTVYFEYDEHAKLPDLEKLGWKVCG